MPRLMVCLTDAKGAVRTATCDLPVSFLGVGAVTIHFGDWFPSTFHVHAAPQLMDRRSGDRREGRPKVT